MASPSRSSPTQWVEVLPQSKLCRHTFIFMSLEVCWVIILGSPAKVQCLKQRRGNGNHMGRTQKWSVCMLSRRKWWSCSKRHRLRCVWPSVDLHQVRTQTHTPVIMRFRCIVLLKVLKNTLQDSRVLLMCFNNYEKELKTSTFPLVLQESSRLSNSSLAREWRRRFVKEHQHHWMSSSDTSSPPVALRWAPSRAAVFGATRLSELMDEKPVERPCRGMTWCETTQCTSQSFIHWVLPGSSGGNARVVNHRQKAVTTAKRQNLSITAESDTMCCEMAMRASRTVRWNCKQKLS